MGCTSLSRCRSIGIWELEEVSAVVALVCDVPHGLPPHWTCHDSNTVALSRIISRQFQDVIRERFGSSCETEPMPACGQCVTKITLRKRPVRHLYATVETDDTHVSLTLSRLGTAALEDAPTFFDWDDDRERHLAMAIGLPVTVLVAIPTYKWMMPDTTERSRTFVIEWILPLLPALIVGTVFGIAALALIRFFRHQLPKQDGVRPIPLEHSASQSQTENVMLRLAPEFERIVEQHISSVQTAWSTGIVWE